MKIESLAYGEIIFGGEKIHLPSCTKCGQIVAMTDEEYHNLPSSELGYLNAHIECCDAPNFMWRRTVKGMPQIEKEEVKTMKQLTALEAINQSIEVWKRMSDSGGNGEEKRQVCIDLYGEGYPSGCPLCLYARGIDDGGCGGCPYRMEHGGCQDAGNPYCEWDEADTVRERRRYALAFLGQLYDLKEKYEDVTIKVGDKVRVQEGIKSPIGGFVFGKWDSPADVGVVVRVSGDMLSVKFPKASSNFSCSAKQMEVVPKEHWEDITDEIELDEDNGFFGLAVDLDYEGETVASLGYEGITDLADGYKVEKVESASYKGWIKVSKRVDAPKKGWGSRTS